MARLSGNVIIRGTGKLRKLSTVVEEDYTFPLASIAIFAFEPEEQGVQTLWQDPEAETDPITEAGQRIAGVRDFRSGDLVAFQEYDAGPIWFGPDQGFSPDPVWNDNGWFYEWLEVDAQRLQNFDGVLIVATTRGTYPLEVSLPDGTQYEGDSVYYLLPVNSMPVLAYLFYPNQTFGPTIDTEIARLVQRGAGPAGSLAEVEDFSYTWSEMGLKRFPLIDVSSGANFEYAWGGNPKLVTFPDLNFSAGTNFRGSWADCSKMEEFSETEFPLGTNFSAAWNNCNSLNAFPLIDFPAGINFGGENIGNDIISGGAWQNCTNMQFFAQISVPLGENFAGAWNNCSSLQSFPKIDFPSGLNFQQSWKACTSLETFLPEDFASATNFREAWTDCINLSSFSQISVPLGIDFVSAWKGCTSLQTFPEIEFPSGVNFGGFLQGTGAWEGCSNLQFFPQIDFLVGLNFRYAWRDCSSLESFPLITVPMGTLFRDSWRGCSNLITFPAIEFPSGIDFTQAWFLCTSLQSFPATEFPSGTNFLNAWSNCSSMTSFSGFNFSAAGLSTGTVGDFFNGFLQAWQNCTSLANVPAGIFDNCSAKNFQDAFVNCALTQQSVDNILISLVNAGQIDGRIDITGGTNSAPGAAGQAAKSTLVSRGWQVSTN
jgi:hypothetical protein